MQHNRLVRVDANLYFLYREYCKVTNEEIEGAMNEALREWLGTSGADRMEEVLLKKRPSSIAQLADRGQSAKAT